MSKKLKEAEAQKIWITPPKFFNVTSLGKGAMVKVNIDAGIGPEFATLEEFSDVRLTDRQCYVKVLPLRFADYRKSLTQAAPTPSVPTDTEPEKPKRGRKKTEEAPKEETPSTPPAAPKISKPKGFENTENGLVRLFYKNVLIPGA